jgi:hypothetical protein
MLSSGRAIARAIEGQSEEAREGHHEYKAFVGKSLQITEDESRIRAWQTYRARIVEGEFRNALDDRRRTSRAGHSVSPRRPRH